MSTEEVHISDTPAIRLNRGYQQYTGVEVEIHDGLDRWRLTIFWHNRQLRLHPTSYERSQMIDGERSFDFAWHRNDPDDRNIERVPPPPTAAIDRIKVLLVADLIALDPTSGKPWTPTEATR